MICGSGGWSEAADHAVVDDQFRGCAREHTLGAVGDMELLAAQTAHQQSPGRPVIVPPAMWIPASDISGTQHRRNGWAAAST